MYYEEDAYAYARSKGFTENDLISYGVNPWEFDEIDQLAEVFFLNFSYGKKNTSVRTVFFVCKVLAMSVVDV